MVFGYNNTPWTPSSYTIGNVQNFSTIRFDNATWGKTITVHYFANQSTDSTVTKVDATNVAFSGVDSLSSGDSYDMLTIDEELASGSLELTSENSTYTIGTTLEGTGKVSLSDDGKTVHLLNPQWIQLLNKHLLNLQWIQLLNKHLLNP